MVQTEKNELTVLSHSLRNQGLDSIIQTDLGTLRLSRQPDQPVGSVNLFSVTHESLTWEGLTSGNGSFFAKVLCVLQDCPAAEKPDIYLPPSPKHLDLHLRNGRKRPANVRKTAPVDYVAEK